MTAAHGMAPKRATFPRLSAKVVISALAAVAIQLALVAAWAGAMGKPALHEQPVGLVVVPPGGSVAAPAISVRPADAVSWRPLPDAATATRAVRHGDLAGALVVRDGRQTLLVASAGGAATAQALTQVFTGQAQATGAAFQVRDLRPLHSDDPRGLGVFVLVLGWVIGGYAGAMLLVRAFGPRVRRMGGMVGLLISLAGYAVAAAALGVLLIDPLLGMVTGHPAELIGVGALLVFAVAAFATAMLTLMGPAGLMVAVATLVILGNPASGGMVPVSMLPDGWRFLGEVLPNAAGVHLVRAVSYFGGHGISDPLIVLICYAGAALLVTTAVTWRRRKTAPRMSAAAMARDEVESMELAIAASGTAL